MPASHHNHPEASERSSVTTQPALSIAKPGLIEHGKLWPTYPPEWVSRITRIAQIQETLQESKALGLDWTDKQFTGELTITGVWPSMRRGLYPVPSKATVKTKWLAELDALEQHAKAYLKRVAGTAMKGERSLADFVETTDYRAVKRAIDQAKKRATTHNQDRAVAYIAKTGGGKTTLAMKLMEEGVVDWYAEATPSWKRSYRALLLSLAETWALPMPGRRQSTLDLETAIIRHARSLSGVLLVEEVDTLCSSSQEFLKLLLNRSTLVVCIFMTPEARESLRGQGGSQLAQLFRRFEAQIESAPLKPDDILPFEPTLWSKTTKEQRHQVVEAANTMGGIDAIKRIGQNLTSLTANSEVNDEAVNRAVRLYRMAVPVVRTQMGRRAA